MQTTQTWHWLQKACFLLPSNRMCSQKINKSDFFGATYNPEGLLSKSDILSDLVREMAHASPTLSSHDILTLPVRISEYRGGEAFQHHDAKNLIFYNVFGRGSSSTSSARYGAGWPDSETCGRGLGVGR